MSTTPSKERFTLDTTAVTYGISDLSSTLHQRAQYLTPDELGQMHEDVLSYARKLEEQGKLLRQCADTIDQLLTEALGPGEAVLVGNRIAYRGELSDGSASINKAAFDELATELPDYLRPRTITKYTTVTAVRDAQKRGDITRAQLHELLIEPPKRPGIRWHTPQETVDGEAE